MAVGRQAEELGPAWLEVKQGILRKALFVFLPCSHQRGRVGLTFHKRVPQPDVSSNEEGGGHLSPCG